MTRGTLADRIAEATGRAVRGLSPIGSGTAGDRLHRALFEDGGHAMVKSATAGDHLAVEGRMLHFLTERSDLPVPAILASAPDFLVMEEIDAGGILDAEGEAQAADMIARLHGVTADRHGLDFDTVIGGLAQPNGWDEDWRRFFAEKRLLAMAKQGRDAGRLPGDAAHRLPLKAGAAAARLGRQAARAHVPHREAPAARVARQAAGLQPREAAPAAVFAAGAAVAAAAVAARVADGVLLSRGPVARLAGPRRADPRARDAGRGHRRDQ